MGFMRRGKRRQPQETVHGGRAALTAGCKRLIGVLSCKRSEPAPRTPSAGSFGTTEAFAADEMDTANRNSLSKRLGGHSEAAATSFFSDCFSDIIVERYPGTSFAPTCSSPQAGGKICVCSGFPAATYATECTPVLSEVEQSPCDVSIAGSAASETNRNAPSVSAAFSGAVAACAPVMSETNHRGTVLFDKSAAVSIPCIPSGGDTRRCDAAGVRSVCDSCLKTQPLALNPRPPAASHYLDTATTNASKPSESNRFCHIKGTAMRPAARVIRVNRFPHQQEQDQRSERASGRLGQRRASAVVERENDAELQQIARQEQEVSDDGLRFTIGDIVERPTCQPQELEAPPRSQDLDVQQMGHQGQVSVQLQRHLPDRALACVFDGALLQTSQQASARRSAPVSTPANATAAAVAYSSGSDVFEKRTPAHLSQAPESCFLRDRHVAVEAPLGFPQPVHRRILQQLLDIRRGKQPSQGDCRAQENQQQQVSGEIHEAQELQRRNKSSVLLQGGLGVEERQAMRDTHKPPCVIDGESGFHVPNLPSCRFTPAENDRARIETEAAELLRAMQPHEIAAARQELLDRFGPRRFSALQRRALRRAASQQRSQLAHVHDDISRQRVSVAKTANQQNSCQEAQTSSGCPVVDGNNVGMPSGFFPLSSSTETMSPVLSLTASRGHTSDLLNVQTASPTALVFFTPESRPDTAAEGASATGRPNAAFEEIISGDDASPASPAASVRTAPALPKAGSVVRFDLHEVAKLRWTDPLGPEDWRQDPVGYVTDFMESETPSLFHSQVQHKQITTPHGAHCGGAATVYGGKEPSSANCPGASSCVRIHLEGLRFDFEGCLRSDVFYAQKAAESAVAGVRAAAMRQGRRLRMATAQQLKPLPRDLPEQSSAAFRRQLNKLGGTHVSSSKSGAGEAARNQLGKKRVDTQPTSTEIVRADMLQDGSEDIGEEASEGGDPLEFHRGLHHHGEAAALPGYTLPELVHLAQSSNPAQASLALQTLAAVIRTGRTLFTCPSIADAAAFAASVRRWADVWQQGASRIKRDPRSEPRPRETLVGEQALREQKNTEEPNERLPLPRHSRQAYLSSPQQVENSCLGPAGEAAVGSVDSLSAANSDTHLLSHIYFETKAGYGVGLTRWHNYVTRDLYLAWRLHALLHAHTTAVHRAALSCLAALFGPPTLSGIRRLPFAPGNFVPNAAYGAVTRARGKGNVFESQDSSISGSTLNTQTHIVRESDGTSNLTNAFSGDTKRCDREAAGCGAYKNALLYKQRTQHGVYKESNVDGVVRVTARPISERNGLAALVHRGDAHWGPGWASFPLYVKHLPRQLARQLLKLHHFDQGHQQQEEDFYQAHSSPDARQQPNARQQTWPYGERAAAVCLRGGLKGIINNEGINYICMWTLGGLDFLSEGLSVLDCCSGLRSIGAHHGDHLSDAGAVGEDSSAGCRGEFAFWHAIFGRIIADATNCPATSYQPLQQAASTMRSVVAREGPTRDEEKLGENEKRQCAESAPPIVEKLNTPEGAVAPQSAVHAKEERSWSVTKSVATAGNDPCTLSTNDDDKLHGRASATQAVPSEEMPEKFLQSQTLAGAYERGDSTAEFLYDSVGALFSCSPAKALLGCGSLLDRLTLLLSIYQTDEDVERNAIQLLIGLSAGGPASITYMLSNAPLQKRIRCLAEGLLVGSEARSERMQRQRRQKSLALATCRAAASSRSSTTAGVYFVARAELGRQEGYNTKNGDWNSVTRGSGSNSRKTSGVCKSQKDITCPNMGGSFETPEETGDDTLDVESSLLRRADYLLLRELLVLLRLWAGWAPSGVENSKAVSNAEADAAAAWRDTLVGYESACCALLLQTLTSGLSILAAGAATNGTISSPSSLRNVMSGRAAAGAVTAALCQRTDCDKHDPTRGGSHGEGKLDVMTAEPADEDVLIAAVEAARVLRLLEANGALQSIFPFFYPAAVQIMHAFTKRLEKMQGELMRTTWQDDRCNKLHSSTHFTATNEQEKLLDKEAEVCELELELKQHMQELQQHDLDLQKQVSTEEASVTPDILQELGAAALDFIPPLVTNTDIADLTLSQGASTHESGEDVERSSSGSENDVTNLQRDIAVTWLFQGELIKGVLRWAGVAAIKKEPSQDATGEAYDFLMQVAPFLRIIPSLLTCWNQLGSLDEVPETSFVSASALQILQAAMQLLLRTSQKLAHALCSSSVYMSTSWKEISMHGPVRHDARTAVLRHSVSCSGTPHATDEKTSNRQSTTADIQDFRDTSKALEDHTITMQQAALKCWISLVKPLVNILIGSADEQSLTDACRNTGSSTNATSSLGALPEAVLGIAAGAGSRGAPGAVCCLEQNADADGLLAEHGSGSADKKGKLKTTGALLLLLKRMKDTCTHEGGSTLANALSLYAIETGWTCLTSCCCSQCLPLPPLEKDVTTSCEKTSPNAKPGRHLWYRQWRGVIPATSESFAGTDLETRFAALYNSCNMTLPKHPEGQQDDVAPLTATVTNKSDSSTYENIGTRASCNTTTELNGDTFSEGKYSYHAAKVTGVTFSNSCNNVCDDTGTPVSGNKCSKDKAVVPPRGPRAAQWLPQDVELFLSKASFLSTTACWVASSLHLLHHWQTYPSTCDRAAGLKSQVKSSPGFAIAHNSRENGGSNGIEDCTPQHPNCRRRSVEQSLEESDGSSRSGSLRCSGSGLGSAKVTDNKHSHIFSPTRLKELAVAAAALAFALRGALQHLFRGLRWPRQSPSPCLTATKGTGFSCSAVSKTASHPDAQQRACQSYHETGLSHHQNAASQREYKPETRVRHQATATSGPLLLFEPLAQLMLSLQLLLRACDPSLSTWNAAEEQICLLAACSVAATPQTFLRALLLLYHSVRASSLLEVSGHSNLQSCKRMQSECHLPAADRFWLKGAAHWYSLCVSVSSPAQHRAIAPTAQTGGRSTVDGISVYEVLVKATEAAQRGIPLKQQTQQTGAVEGIAWPWVLCAIDSLDMILSNAEIHQTFFFRGRGKNEPAYAGTPQRPQRVCFSQRLAVCPIDAAVGGGLWQCFCCAAARTSDHDVTDPNSDFGSMHLSEDISLCHLVLSMPNIVRELSHYVPPASVFAALISLYADPQLARGLGSGTVSSTREQSYEATTEVDTPRASAFSIYARPDVYHNFCELLDKLFLQPLGVRLRDHALRAQENQLQSQNQKVRRVCGGQQCGEQMQGKDRAWRVLYQREHETEVGDEQEKEARSQEKHQPLDRVRSRAPLFSCTAPSWDSFYFTKAFLAVFNGVNQTDSGGSLKALPSTAPSAKPRASVVLPSQCLHWFPVCCNKAHDVLINHTARLLLISQNAAEAADPLLSLLLWLLSSPAFPFECRRILLRGEQAWLKIASQLFCFVYSAGGFSLQRAHQHLNCFPVRQQLQQSALNQIRAPLNQKQAELLQHVGQLDYQLHQEKTEEVNQQPEPGELHGRNANSPLSEPALLAGETCDLPAWPPRLEQQGYWGMQSPRGDVFWFRAPESLYVVVPGMWREESEEILTGWSSYVRDRLSKGLLLIGWQPAVGSEQETAGYNHRSGQAATRHTSYVAALFPLHAVALLVADDLNDLVTSLPGPPQVRQVTRATLEQAQQQLWRTRGRQQAVVQDRIPCAKGESHALYGHEGTDVSVAGLKRPVSASRLGHREDSPPGSAVPSILRKEAGSSRQNSPINCREHIDTNSFEFTRVVKGLMASECPTGSEAVVAVVTKQIARTILEHVGSLPHTERTP